MSYFEYKQMKVLEIADAIDRSDTSLLDDTTRMRLMEIADGARRAFHQITLADRLLDGTMQESVFNMRWDSEFGAGVEDTPEVEE